MAGNVTVVMDMPALNAFRSWDGALGQSVNRLARETTFRQKVRAPKRTGALGKSLTVKRGGNPSGKGIWFEAGSWTISYTIFMDQGTKPHEIKAKGNGTLVFFWPKVGKVVGFKSVQHPGTKAYDFLNGGLVSAMNMWGRGG